MSAAAGGGLPTRSEIEGWNTSYLISAAERWRTAALGSENAFIQHRQNIDAPGGTDWSGDAKDAALSRVAADLSVVRAQGEVQRAAATIADSGSRDIETARHKVLEAIAEAEADGFRVGEDLSVTDTRRVDITELALRQTIAVEHAEDIRWNADQLAQVDGLVGDRLTGKAAELDGVRFEGEGEPAVQLVDNTFSLAPGEGGGATGGEVREVIDKLPQGDKPWIREVRTPQDLERLWQWAKQNGGVEVPNAYGDPSKGTAIRMPDGTQIGQRYTAGSTGNPAIDIKFPEERGNTKIHINPRGGVPELPGMRPTVEPPRLPAAEPPPIRIGGAPSADYLPQQSEPRQAGDTDLPVVGDGKPDNPEF